MLLRQVNPQGRNLWHYEGRGQGGSEILHKGRSLAYLFQATD